MSAASFEMLLARLYADEGVRREFLCDPRGVARRSGLDEREVEALAAIDRIGLEMAAESFRRKRAAHAPKHRRTWRERLYSAFASAAALSKTSR